MSKDRWGRNISPINHVPYLSIHVSKPRKIRAFCLWNYRHPSAITVRKRFSEVNSRALLHLAWCHVAGKQHGLPILAQVMCCTPRTSLAEASFSRTTVISKLKPREVRKKLGMGVGWSQEKPAGQVHIFRSFLSTPPDMRRSRKLVRSESADYIGVIWFHLGFCNEILETG